MVKIKEMIIVFNQLLKGTFALKRKKGGKNYGKNKTKKTTS